MFDPTCLHEDYAVSLSVNSIMTTRRREVRCLELVVTCKRCGEAMRPTGVVAGNSPNHPTYDFGSNVITIPIALAALTPPEFGDFN